VSTIVILKLFTREILDFRAFLTKVHFSYFYLEKPKNKKLYFSIKNF
jgi:hypothetical protein